MKTLYFFQSPLTQFAEILFHLFLPAEPLLDKLNSFKLLHIYKEKDERERGNAKGNVMYNLGMFMAVEHAVHRQNKMYKENEHHNLTSHLFLVYIKYKTLCQI